jgi:hypothetical protein
MTYDTVPEQPAHAFRIVLELKAPAPRLDQVLLTALRGQARNQTLMRISRTDFKELFKKRKIRIKGQIATPSSGLAKGTTYVDILGFGVDEDAEK